MNNVKCTICKQENYTSVVYLKERPVCDKCMIKIIIPILTQRTVS